MTVGSKIASNSNNMSFYLLCGIVTTIVLTSSSSPFYFPRLSTSPTAQTQQIITYIQNLRDTAGFETGGIPRPQIPSLALPSLPSLPLQHTFFRDPRDLIPCIALFAVFVGLFKHKIDITERDIALITHISAFAAASPNNPHTLLLDIDPTVYRQIAAHLRRLTPPEYFPSQSRWDTHTIMLAWEPLWRLCANTLASTHDNDPARRALSAFYSQPTAAQFRASDHGPSVQTLIESANPLLREGVTPNASPFLSTSVVGRPLVAFTRWIFGSQNERGSPAPGNVEAGNGARRDGNGAAFIPEWMPMAAGIIVASILHASEASV
ncbi:hypothetical protein PC9H_001610 [Pleurotus ostreatus]|uniref:Uncharacterized protein n=1 Tax=Pleurotus ostreatus TaxID=5322 RepID=A0A8H7E0F3_PLEOS|nr:uncharacterized protein PC9H_001610 [Pleurotus ostreatus]KAF7441261.1 hypothetical protein PC9H_001610 [Pleurotus ostreatus]KAJ8699220.1 hypothetical protein PTI98_002359 [Pleurotus ostreatus]